MRENWKTCKNCLKKFKAKSASQKYCGLTCKGEFNGKIKKIQYEGTVHDFEIDTPHDYTVAHLGIAHNGGGKRAGSIACYMEPWHADVLDFLKLKLNTGMRRIIIVLMIVHVMVAIVVLIKTVQ